MAIIAIRGKKGSGKDTVTKIKQLLTVPNNNFTTEDIIRELEKPTLASLSSTWENKKFAAKLKEIVHILTGIPVEDLEKEEVKNSYLGEEWDKYHRGGGVYEDKNTFIKNLPSKHIEKFGIDKLLESNRVRITVRELLQKVGTDALRNVIHPNIHINALFTDYKMDICKGRCAKMTHDDPGNVCMYPPEDCEKGTYSNWIISDLRFPNELEAIRKRKGIVIKIDRDLGDKVKDEHESETALDNNTDYDHYIDNRYDLHTLIENVCWILIQEEIIKGENGDR